jgi:hypothetical protein
MQEPSSLEIMVFKVNSGCLQKVPKVPKIKNA